MKLTRGALVCLAALAFSAVLVSGCIIGKETMGSGESMRTWQGGKLTKTYQADYERVWTACSKTIHDLQLSIESENHDALVGRIKARRADDQIIRVDVDNVGSKLARVTILSGLLGTESDKNAAMVIMDTIDKKLGK